MPSLLDQQPDDQSGGGVIDGLGRLYRTVTDYLAPQGGKSLLWPEDNPVGTETLQSVGMPKPTISAGLLGEFVNPATGELTDRGQIRFDSPMMNFDTGGIGGTTRLARSVMKLNPDAVGFADRISTRTPTRTPDVHTSPNYTVDYDTFNTPGGPRDAYPGRVAEVIPRHIGVTDTSTEGFITHLTDNIRALWNAVPEQWRAPAMGWYNGAHSLAEDLADRFGDPNKSRSVNVRAQAANLAAQSPQRQWEHNVEGSTRTADIVANHSNTPWNVDHERAWNGTPEIPATATSPAVPEVAGFRDTNPDWTDGYNNIIGKKLSEVTDPVDAALWVRLHDRAYAPHNNVRVVNPDGTFGDWLRKADGTPENIQWGNLGAIGNAIDVLRNDKLDNISLRMGDAHKVRNFYNNIVSPDAGHDVTIDTHAASAALLRPLGSSNPEVSYALGSSVKKNPWRLGPDPWPTTMNSDPRGLSGLYPLYAEAYRRVADQLGVLPRQVQSVTWEGIRGLYNDVDRRNGPLMKQNGDVWRAVNDGTTTADEARATLLARGIRPPNWHGE